MIKFFSIFLEFPFVLQNSQEIISKEDARRKTNITGGLSMLIGKKQRVVVRFYEDRIIYMICRYFGFLYGYLSLDKHIGKDKKFKMFDILCETESNSLLDCTFETSQKQIISGNYGDINYITCSNKSN